MVEEEYHSILLGIKVKGLSNSELNKPKKCTCSNILGKYRYENVWYACTQTRHFNDTSN